MLPVAHSQQLYEFPASSNGALYPNNGSHASTPFATSSGTFRPSHPPANPNTPELFNQNINLALQYAEYISRLAKSALDGIDQAFHPAPQSNPMAAASDLTTLHHCIQMFTSHLVNSGVGALPMIPLPSDGSAPAVPSEASLLEETTKAVNALYERQKQIQENSAVVANLLAAPEGSRR